MGEDLFGLTVSEFQSMVNWLSHHEPAVRQGILATGGCNRAKLLTSWELGSKEPDKGTQDKPEDKPQ
jgi:hypothetical protein